MRGGSLTDHFCLPRVRVDWGYVTASHCAVTPQKYLGLEFRAIKLPQDVTRGRHPRQARTAAEPSVIHYPEGMY